MSEPDWKPFVNAMLEASWDGLDADGGDIQDLAEKFGLIKLVKVWSPCGENCRCASYEFDFPVECYRKTYE